jgi:hypothetical protein
MTEGDIKEYTDEAGTGKYIRLFGYTSTSVNQNVALGFAWQNKDSGHTKVLFHIKWDSPNGYAHYYLNAGAFDSEKEVLLADGVKVKVESVDEVKNDKDVVLYTLITLAN